MSMCTEIIQALVDLRLVISASNKNVLTLEEVHKFFGSGWSEQNLRKYLIDPAKNTKPQKEGLEYDKHYFHTGYQFYIIKDEFEKFLLTRRKY